MTEGLLALSQMSKHKYEATLLRIVLSALFRVHFVLLVCLVQGYFTEHGSQRLCFYGATKA